MLKKELNKASFAFQIWNGSAKFFRKFQQFVGQWRYTERGKGGEEEMLFNFIFSV